MAPSRFARMWQGLLGICEGLRSDGRSAVRTLLKSPAFVMVASVSIALGIGANTAIFTLLDQVLLRMLPVTRPQELVLLTSRGLQYGSGWGDGNELSYPMYEELRDHNDVFTGMFCRFGIDMSISAGDRTERVTTEVVSGSYFPVLGVGSARGRIIGPPDDSASHPAPVVVLSYQYWSARFARDPGVVGSTILLNNHPVTVVGVAQAGFDGTNLGSATQLFVPIQMAPVLTPLTNGLTSRRTRWLNVFGRLRPKVTARLAEAALQPFYSSLLAMEVQDPAFARASASTKERFLKNVIEVRPAAEGKSDLRRHLSGPLAALMAIVVIVLLIACANVANLLIARGTTRQREVAIRLAIGASRGRIVRQLLMESVILAAIGGGIGLVLARWGAGVLLGFVPTGDRVLTVSAAPDGRVLAFTVVVTIATGVMFGLAPAWRSAATAVAPTLHAAATSRTGGPGHHGHLRRALGVAQIALSVVLLIGAGLFLRTLRNLATLDAGLDTAHVLEFEAVPSGNGYDTGKARLFVKTLIDRIRSTPGVVDAGIASHTLLTGGSWNNYITIEGRPVQSVRGLVALNNMISPGFFHATGMHMIAGRELDAADEWPANAPLFPDAPKSTGEPWTRTVQVAIVNEQFVKKFLDGELPLGRHVGFGRDPGTATPIRIVGVVSDAKYTSVRDDVQPQVFFPYFEATTLGGFVMYVRTVQNPSAFIRPVQQIAHELDPNLPLQGVRTLEQQVEVSLTNERLLASLSAAFSVLATLLATVGLYGLMAYMVNRRGREIGIRMALGAVASDMAVLVFHDVAVMVGTGVAIALPLAWASSRLLQGQLYGVTPADPPIIAGAIVLLAVVATIAGLLPALRAARMNPSAALRRD